MINLFKYVEIYKGSKQNHFKNITRNSNIHYKYMLFFDDDQWNIQEVSKLGVLSTHTPHGFTNILFRKALSIFKK